MRPGGLGIVGVKKAITVRDSGAGVGGLTLTDVPYPHAAENDVIVRVRAAPGLRTLRLVTRSGPSTVPSSCAAVAASP